MESRPNKPQPAIPPGLRVPWIRRVPHIATIGLAAAAAVWVEQGREPCAWGFGVGAIALAFRAAGRTSGVERILGWGAAMVVASLGPHGEFRGPQACGEIGAMACAAGASIAIARVPAGGGMVRPAPWSPLLAVAAIATAWCAALVARLVPPDGPLGWVVESPTVWAVGAAAVSTVVLLAATEWTLRRRRLELGVVERMLAIRALLGTSLAASMVLGVLGGAHAEVIGRIAVALASAVVGLAALHPDAVRVARLTRRVVVLTIVGGGVATLGASAVAAGGDAWAVTLVTAAAALAIGAVAPALEAPLRPERGAWLDAFARACVEAARAEPEDAVREALVALRAPTGLSSPSPELWTSERRRAIAVDAAGYLHERDAELPERLMPLAAGEPEGTLRAEVLDALQVRRPDLRPLAQWMSDHQALLATVISCGGETDGALLLPRAARDESPTLEEVRALRLVADRLAPACRARAVQMRMLERANDARQRVEQVEEQMERLRYERGLETGRDALAATRLARSASVGVYSAGSRMAVEALERCTAVGVPIALVAPSGADPVPYLARAHLMGARRDAPLVLVDATSAREHDPARWSDPSASPLALADRGMLVLLDGAGLPAEIQQLVARALGEKRTPWERPEPLDVHLAWTAVVPPERLVAEGRLDPSLALRLGDACKSPVVLPRLRDRVDDLRAVIMDRLACEGLRVLGHPVGIEPAAYARLIEHPFPGEDAELAVIVQRLVVRCAGDIVRVGDVDALRLWAQSPGATRQRRGGRRKSPMSA